MKSREVIIYLYLKANKDQKELWRLIKDKVKLTEEEVEFYKNSNIDLDNYITVLDENYPEEFKTLDNCPIVIEMLKH